MDNFFLLRRAWHNAMTEGNFEVAWAILEELGESGMFAHKGEMILDYVMGA